MPVLLAWIICPVFFGLTFVSHTAYFLYKMLRSRQTDYSGSPPLTTITMTDSEASICMGCLWSTCVDKRTNRMTLKVFLAWYFVVLTIDILFTVLFFVWLYQYNRIYV